jgi:hypothetical protein
MEGGEDPEPPRFSIEDNVLRGGRKLYVLRLHHGATLQNAVEATVDFHCKTVCFNQLFGDMNIFSIVLMLMFHYFYEDEDGPPFLLRRSLHCTISTLLLIHYNRIGKACLSNPIADNV